MPPKGRHAFIGVAFNERNDAFDFNVALADHKRDCDRVNTATKSAAADPAFRDLSLKEGEKITVKIAGATVSFHSFYLVYTSVGNSPAVNSAHLTG